MSFATDWAANFGCDQFRIIPDIVSKLASSFLKMLCCSIQI